MDYTLFLSLGASARRDNQFRSASAREPIRFIALHCGIAAPFRSLQFPPLPREFSSRVCTNVRAGTGKFGQQLRWTIPIKETLDPRARRMIVGKVSVATGRESECWIFGKFSRCRVCGDGWSRIHCHRVVSGNCDVSMRCFRGRTYEVIL